MLNLKVISIFFFLFLFGCKGEPTGTSYSYEIQKVDFFSPKDIHLGQFILEVADTPGKITLGLMYRQKISEFGGMIFYFPDYEPRSFWMKNTGISLDILFADINNKIVTIKENTVPYSTDPIESDQLRAKTVIEILAGTSKKLGITVGSSFKVVP